MRRDRHNLADRRRSNIRFERDAFGTFESKPQTPYYLGYEPGVGYVIESPDGIRNIFDNDGLLSEIRDLNGNHLLMTWSRARSGETLTSVKLMAVVDTVGRTINFVYGADGKLDRVDVLSLGQHVDYEIDNNGDLVSARNAGGISEQYIYDSGHSSALTVAPTAAVTPFCEEACGLSIDSCGGPCVNIAVDAEVSCMMACYDPDSCGERCADACEEPCIEAARGPEATECRGECQDLCTRGCYWSPQECESYATQAAINTPEIRACLREHPHDEESCFHLAPSYAVNARPDASIAACKTTRSWTRAAHPSRFTETKTS